MMKFLKAIVILWTLTAAVLDIVFTILVIKKMREDDDIINWEPESHV